MNPIKTVIGNVTNKKKKKTKKEKHKPIKNQRETNLKKKLSCSGDIHRTAVFLIHGLVLKGKIRELTSI